MKKYIAAILILAVVVILAGWGLVGRGPEATEAGQSDLIFNPRINEPDYPLDGKLFQERFGETMKSRNSNEVPDYPLDGRIFNEYFLGKSSHHEGVQLQALAGGFSTAMQVEAKRMTGMAGNFVNIYGTTPAMYVEGVERTRMAEAARLTGLAIKYGAVPSHISEAVEELIP